jgi:hypothetical protein
VKRATTHGALLVGVILTTLTAAALFATLAGVSGGVLSRSELQRLATMSATDSSIVASGTMSRANLAQADAALRSQLRAALGCCRFTVEQAEVGRALDLPSASGSPRTTSITPVAAAGIRTHATLTAGTWPAPPQPGQPLDIALPADVARMLALPVGARLASNDGFSGAPVPLRISGFFREVDPASSYWGFSAFGATGMVISGNTTGYGPAVADPAAFTAGTLSLESAAWVVQPALTALAADQIRPLAAAVAQLQPAVTQSPELATVTVTTNLPRSLTAAAGDAWAARSALAVATALSALLALAALLLAVRLLRARREIEAATVRARGGRSWQLVALNAGEALTCGVIAAAGGAYGGASLGAALAPTATRLGAPGPGAWLAAGAAALASTLIMAGAAMGVSSPVEAWVRRSRQSTGLALARVGGDVAVVALGAVAVWQLRQITLASTTSDGIDPVLVVAPALALAGATLLLIRLVPLAARLGERWAGRRRGLVGPLVTWDVSRRPARFTGALLLSVLAVATSVFALSMHASWRRSQFDQAAFQTGSDVQVNMVTANPADARAIADAQGVTAATPLATSELDAGTAVAVDAATAPSAIALRPTLSHTPIPALWSGIAPKGKPIGLAIPGTPVRIAVTATLRADQSAAAAVVFTVLDADGVAYQFTADPLPGDGRRHVVSAAVAPSAHALYPLHLVDISLSGAFNSAGLAVVQAASADTATGPLTPFAQGDAFAPWWQSAPATGDGTPSLFPCDVLNGFCAWPSATAPGQLTLDASPPPASVTAIATASFLQQKGARVGDLVPISVNGAALTVRLVAKTDAFPTLGDAPVIVLDLTTLQDAVLASGSPPVIVNRWLLHTRDGGVPPGLPTAAEVTSRQATQTALLDDPLGVPSQRTWIVIALAAAVLAVLGGAVDVAAELRTRRRDAALLAALGVSRWRQLRGLCLERLVLGSVASLLGLGLGAALSALLVVPVTPSAAGTVPVPPVLVTYVWSWSLALAAVVVLGPLAAVAAGTLRRPDAAAQLRLVEAI